MPFHVLMHSPYISKCCVKENICKKMHFTCSECAQFPAALKKPNIFTTQKVSKHDDDLFRLALGVSNNQFSQGLGLGIVRKSWAELRAPKPLATGQQPQKFVFLCFSLQFCCYLFFILNSADKNLQCVFEKNASRWWTQPRHHGEPGLVAFGFRSLWPVME